MDSRLEPKSVRPRSQARTLRRAGRVGARGDKGEHRSAMEGVVTGRPAAAIWETEYMLRWGLSSPLLPFLCDLCQLLPETSPCSIHPQI